MQVSLWVWGVFGAIVLAMLALDLGAFRRPRGAPRDLTPGSAARWSAAWIALALGFGLVVLALYGPAPAVTYVTAYLLEKSLSIDNVFVFVVIFSELQIPAGEQRRVLYWGVLGALVMRGLMIAGGLFLLARFHWVIYPFAGLIVLAALRLLFAHEQQRKAVTSACAACGTWIARILPVTPVMRGGRFWIRQDGKLRATPLFVALIIVETTDVIFALDSVPAVLAITQEQFLVYTSNIFAMLGLRSLYFLLATAVQRFHYLRFGLASILLFVGARMFLTEVVTVPTWLSLAVIASALGLAVAASIARPAPAPAA